MRLALVVTTYERPDALAAVLASAARQDRRPDELLVADDGSSSATRELVQQHAARAPYPVHHLWQPHEDFRAARARNLAITAASAEYLVLIDGDMLLHPRFLQDHEQHARRGSFVQGPRLELDAVATRKVLAADAAGTPALTARHSPALSRLLSPIGNAVTSIKSCNQGYWRHDLLAVSGFNESMIGWGPEDKELAVRLMRHGVRRRTLLFGGLAWHLDHPPASRERRAINEAIFRETRNSYTVRK